MTHRIPLGRLPERSADRVLVSGEYPWLAESFQRLGMETVTTMAAECLPAPVQWHPDMQVCIIGRKIFSFYNSPLLKILAEYDFDTCETVQKPGAVYPADAICNVLAWGGKVLGNPKTGDQAIWRAAEQAKLTWISVKQGYGACTTALVDEQSAITSDMGVAKQLEANGVQVLRIRPGFIKLPGYPYGFIGGCCGKLAPNVMAFAGRLGSHPDGEKMKSFLAMRGVQVTELSDCDLLDVGGLIAL